MYLNSGTEPWRNKQHHQVWSFQTPPTYPFVLDSTTTCNTLLSFVRVGNLKGRFTQNSTSSITRCGRRGRRSLVRSTVKGLHALRTASVAPSQPLDDLPAQFVPTRQRIYVSLQSSPDLRSSSTGLFLAFILFQSDGPLGYSGGRENKICGSTRKREELNFAWTVPLNEHLGGGTTSFT